MGALAGPRVVIYSHGLYSQCGLRYVGNNPNPGSALPNRVLAGFPLRIHLPSTTITLRASADYPGFGDPRIPGFRAGDVWPGYQQIVKCAVPYPFLLLLLHDSETIEVAHDITISDFFSTAGQ